MRAGAWLDREISPRARRFVAYVLVVGLIAFGLYRLGEAQADQCEAIDRFATNVDIELDGRIREAVDQLHEDLEQC